MAVDSVEQPQNGEKESAAAAAAATAAPPATAPAAPPPTVPTEPQKEPGSAEGDKAQSPEVSGRLRGANMGGGLEVAASAGPAPAAATQVVALVGEVCPLFVAARGYASAAFAIEFQLPCTGFAGGLTPLSTGL